jgi:cyclic beta-1,2-glucan synthetase
VHDEHQRQGATNVTARNIITSMRLISDVDWPELVESVSLVDDTLARRAASRRWILRRATSTAAPSRNSRGARNARSWKSRKRHWPPQPGRGREKDPGYHLIAGGRRAFEAAIGYRAPLRSWPGRLSATLGIGGYIGASPWSPRSFSPCRFSHSRERGSTARGSPARGARADPAIDAGVALVNRGVTRGFGATLLPGLELRDGVPSTLRTLVAVPILLTTREAMEEQIERLEIHHLASPEASCISRCSRTGRRRDRDVAEDDALLDAAAAGIAR